MINNPNESGEITNTIYLNNFGLPDSSKLETQDAEPRTSKVLYDSKKRFAVQKIDALGNTIRKSFIPGTGNPDTITDIGGLKTIYTYDGFGRNIRIKTPDGIESQKTYSWEYQGYKVTNSRPGTPTSTIKYNIIGLETYNSRQGQFYYDITNTKSYNVSGFLIEEDPYNDGNKIKYSYDELGRVDTITVHDSLITSISYIGGTTDVKYPDGTTKETGRDALGNIVYVKENNSTAISYSYNSFNKQDSIVSYGTKVSFTYDNYGRQTSNHNPNSGITSFQYDNFGQLLIQEDGRGKSIEIEYDKIGRTKRLVADNDTTEYSYYSFGVNKGKVESIVKKNKTAQSFRYDNLGRLVRQADSIPADNKCMVTTYGYNSLGLNSTITYPSGISISYVYDSNNRGYLSEIWSGTQLLWTMNSTNQRGQPTRYYLGSTQSPIQIDLNYDTQARISGIKTGQMKQTYVFDAESGNLYSRDYRIFGSQTGLTEHFTYDNLSRITTSCINGASSDSIIYGPNGNILHKFDVGDYSYDQTMVNAVNSVSNNRGIIDTIGQIIEYNSFNLTTSISEGQKEFTILYAPNNQRIKSVFNPGQGSTITKYYSVSYERVESDAATREIHYIASGSGLSAIIVKDEDTTRTYFVETDHLGSIIGLLNPDGTYAEKASFDPWGRRRNPTDWSFNNVPVPVITDRGFTGHEHLDQFGLINMNGRMYDPVLGRFLSVDPVIQSPDFSQSFNGYSYCLNNPLRYFDPSGYVTSVLDAANKLLSSQYGGYWIPAKGEPIPYTSETADLCFNAYKILADLYEIPVYGILTRGYGIDITPGSILKDHVGGVSFFFTYDFSEFDIGYNFKLGLVYLRSMDYLASLGPSGQGGYSVWQNAAEKSGYASDVLAGLGNGVYSEYNGVKRWAGKNGNFFNSSKVRMNGGYARSAQLAKSASMTYKIAGHSMTALNVGFTTVEFAFSDKSGDDYARLVSAGIGVGLGFVPLIGPGLAIIYGIADSAGVFDGIYNYFDH